MSSEVNKQYQNLLIELLKATHQKQSLYTLLSNNINKIDENLALTLRKWAVEQFKHRPNTAMNIAKVIYEFSKAIHSWELGNFTTNLEIAIAGYETALQVYTYETFPQDWYQIQQSLLAAYQQRQNLLSITIAELKHQAHQSLNYFNNIFAKLPQELKQAEQQIESLKNELIELKQQQFNFVKTDAIQSLMIEVQKINQTQSNIGNCQFANLSKNSAFNTAIFYDIENLNISKANSQTSFSFKNIQDNLKKITSFKKPAIQCAYADWSESRLKLLKDEIQELGVAAIQIFDFGHNKNAADIQLSIDVMELVALRPHIQVFVIVSGDGGFASLAKKLHEYGKTVIGCGYEGKINRFFQSICDYFIILPSLQTKTDELPISSANEFVKNTSDDIFLETKLIIQRLKKENKIEKDGIPIAQVHTLLKAEIPNFDEKRKKEENCKKLSTFFKKVVEGTDICVSDNNNKLSLKTHLSANTVAPSKNSK
ncbi:NYN domain-containing protein [Anabaena azotica]|uniref:NYN domain-containing protein n=1 Tax=Anabaena azotica FACHB-119 TaxID=947527 RepID=A0ABR8D3Z6_9NOST|nr:NYN domain-containing protein [Anabaena azotica]MBD2500886.1 NYN domain-containing protein [Anabaena azotica FACHB-119]